MPVCKCICGARFPIATGLLGKCTRCPGCARVKRVPASTTESVHPLSPLGTAVLPALALPLAVPLAQFDIVESAAMGADPTMANSLNRDAHWQDAGEKVADAAGQAAANGIGEAAVDVLGSIVEGAFEVVVDGVFDIFSF